MIGMPITCLTFTMWPYNIIMMTLKAHGHISAILNTCPKNVLLTFFVFLSSMYTSPAAIFHIGSYTPFHMYTLTRI